MVTEWTQGDGSVQQRKADGDLGGTMRLGEQECVLKEGSLARELYGVPSVMERHRHRYEVNEAYVADLEAKGMVISGRSGDGELVEMIEFADHPWFVACQFHPEFTSSPRRGHPLFAGFIGAALTRVDARATPAACTRRYVAQAGKPRLMSNASMPLCGFEVGPREPLFLIAGPCVIESEALALDTAGTLKEICADLGVPFIYKSSFDKANRSSHESYRGPGIEAGLKVLETVKRQLDVPVLTDVHEDTPLNEVASVVSVLQTPAFLCRQTNFIQRVASSGLPVNIKKGQFLSPEEMAQVIAKARATGNEQIMACERGASFGYNNLVSDMRGLAIMRGFGAPVVFDATHSVQMPGGLGKSSGGRREMVPVLARAAVAAGISGLFMESHPDPDKALSDGPNSWPTGRMRDLLAQLVALDRVTKSEPYIEDAMLAG